MTLAPILILLGGIAAGVPVALAIGMAALSFFLTSGTMPPEIFVQRMVAVTHSFPLLAIPLFVMTGVVMNFAGITTRMMNFAEAMTGHWKGGLAEVNVPLSTLMGGVSGSANADAAMQSKVLVPEMTRRGYDPAFSSAVTAASSIISVEKARHRSIRSIWSAISAAAACCSPSASSAPSWKPSGQARDKSSMPPWSMVRRA